MAERNNFPEIETLISQYAEVLLEKNDAGTAIELYRRVKQNQKSANLLYKTAKRLSKEAPNQPIRIKKAFVLAAIELEKYRRSKTANLSASAQTTQALANLIADDKNMASVDPQFAMRPWRAAEAYHLYLLAQRQYYSGMTNAALRTVISNYFFN